MDIMKRILNSPALSRRNKNNASFKEGIVRGGGRMGGGGRVGEAEEGGGMRGGGGLSATLPARFNAPVEGGAGGHHASEQSRYFGVALEELLEREEGSASIEEEGGESETVRGIVPNLVRSICEFICVYGLREEGLFRVGGNVKVIERLRNQFERDRGEPVLPADEDVTALSSLLKTFLRELPRKLVPLSITKQLIAIQQAKLSDAERNTEMKRILSADDMPRANYSTLKYLLSFLVLVTGEGTENKMNPTALGIVFGPSIFAYSSDLMEQMKEQGATNHIMQQLITHYDAIFITEDNEISPYSPTFNLNSTIKTLPRLLSTASTDSTLQDTCSLLSINTPQAQPIQEQAPSLLAVNSLQSQPAKPQAPPSRPPPPKFSGNSSPRRRAAVGKHSLAGRGGGLEIDSDWSNGVDDEGDGRRSPSPSPLDSDRSEACTIMSPGSTLNAELVDAAIHTAVTDLLFGSTADLSDSSGGPPSSSDEPNSPSYHLNSFTRPTYSPPPPLNSYTLASTSAILAASNSPQNNTAPVPLPRRRKQQASAGQQTSHASEHFDTTTTAKATLHRGGQTNVHLNNEQRRNWQNNNGHNNGEQLRYGQNNGKLHDDVDYSDIADVKRKNKSRLVPPSRPSHLPVSTNSEPALNKNTTTGYGATNDVSLISINDTLSSFKKPSGPRNRRAPSRPSSIIEKSVETNGSSPIGSAAAARLAGVPSSQSNEELTTKTCKPDPPSRPPTKPQSLSRPSHNLNVNGLVTDQPTVTPRSNSTPPVTDTSSTLTTVTPSRPGSVPPTEPHPTASQYVNSPHVNDIYDQLYQPATATPPRASPRLSHPSSYSEAIARNESREHDASRPLPTLRKLQQQSQYLQQQLDEPQRQQHLQEQQLEGGRVLKGHSGADEDQDDVEIINASDSLATKYASHSTRMSSPQAFLQEPVTSPRVHTVATYLSAHPDANVPPSPPSQQTFNSSGCNKAMEDSDWSGGHIRRLTKQIQGLKKKIKGFEEAYEAQHGYKPSQSTKTSDEAVKQIILELNRSRSELRQLKQGNSTLVPSNDYSLHNGFSAMMPQSECSGTDMQRKESSSTALASADETYFEIVRDLAKARQLAQRSEKLDDMTRDQLLEEKLQVQKSLLHFECIHGRPESRSKEKVLVRSLYDRYRSIKRLLANQGAVQLSHSNHSSSIPLNSDSTVDHKKLDPVPEDDAIIQFKHGTDSSQSTTIITERVPMLIPTEHANNDDVEGVWPDANHATIRSNQKKRDDLLATRPFNEDREDLQATRPFGTKSTNYRTSAIDRFDHSLSNRYGATTAWEDTTISQGTSVRLIHSPTSTQAPGTRVKHSPEALGIRPSSNHESTNNGSDDNNNMATLDGRNEMWKGPDSVMENNLRLSGPVQRPMPGLRQEVNDERQARRSRKQKLEQTMEMGQSSRPLPKLRAEVRDGREEREEDAESRSDVGMRYADNITRLTVSELLIEHERLRADKHAVQKVIRIYENDFLREHGRRVQKEDRSATMNQSYTQYKQVRAKIKLVEKLIEKQKPVAKS